MATIANLDVVIGADTGGLDKGLSKASSSVGGFASGLGNMALGAAKVFGTAMLSIGAAGVTAGAALGKAVITSYADYEQLVGGVDTLFKDSSGKVQEYASNAFKTAGLSANAYMETVTGFSASLLQSLGGDTAKAADYADQAVRDMSDNANKMGTDMSLIQSAYQGFAKQNYTMLDNLKLGYGGTKEEMQRLLDDASKISGIEYDISSFADVTQALNVMQTEMGITGTTALEAEKTISGSLNTLTGSFQNLLTGLGDPGADVEKLMGDVITAFNNVVTNVTPVIDNLIAVLPTAFDSLLAAITDVAPDLISTASGLFVKLIDAIVGLLPELVPVAIQLLTSLGDALLNAVPTLLDAASQIMTALFTSLSQNAQPISDAVVSILMTFANFIITNLPVLIDTALQIIIALANGLAAALPTLIPSIVTMVLQIVTTIMDNLPMLLEAALNIIVALVQGLMGALPLLIEYLPTLLETIVSFIIENLPVIIEAAVEIIFAIMEGLIQALPDLIMLLPELIKAIIDAFANTDWLSVGTNIVEGIGGGITDGVTSLVNSAIQACTELADSVKDFFGIASPSKLMKGYGKYIPEGFAVGVEDNAYMAADAISGMIPDKLATNISNLGQAQANREMSNIPSPMPVEGSYGYITSQPVTQKVEVSGTIRHEGINNRDELVAVVEQTIDEKLQWEYLLRGA